MILLIVATYYLFDINIKINSLSKKWCFYFICYYVVPISFCIFILEFEFLLFVVLFLSFVFVLSDHVAVIILSSLS